MPLPFRLSPQPSSPLPSALHRRATVQYNSLLNVRLERHAQPPAHRISDEGEPAVRRAGDARALECDEPVRQASRSAATARRNSSCTTDRRMPTAASTSARRSTRFSKISSSNRKSMSGFDAPYVVGYDCHGLPIELKVDKELGPKKREMSVAEFCRACRAYAERFVGTMTEQFQRLGILGTWDQPYLTMDFRYQAAIARTFGRFVEKGLVYKGKKPVHWCIHCRTALAEAEVEYADHVSPSIYVEFPLAPESQAELASRVPELAGRDVSVVIWTTTPWTIPSNLAIAFHPEFDYAAYEVDGRAVIMAEALAPRVAEATGLTLRQRRSPR